MAQSVARPSSWWAHPEVQRTRDSFTRAMLAELPRMTADESAAARVDALVSVQWSQGFPSRRRGPSRIPGAMWSAS